MTERILQLTIDTTQAKVNLDQLGQAFDRAAAGAAAFKSATAGLSGADRNIGKMAEGVQKLALASKGLNGVTINAALPARITQFAQALDALGAAKTISQAKISSIAAFSKAISGLKAPAGNFTAMLNMLNSLAAFKAPSAAQTLRLKEFFVTMSSIAGSKTISPTQISSITRLATALSALSNFNPPTTAKIARIKELFNVLASMHAIPNAAGIAHSLDTVGAAAQRASNGFAGLPPRILSTGNAARNTGPHLFRLSGNLEHLSSRFSLAYQSGTLFTMLFSTFTIGEFVRKVYDANIEVLKLQKGMLFATGSFAGADTAMNQFYATNFKLGLSIKDSIQQFSRLAISAQAAGMPLAQAQNIYEGVGTALQVVGASSEQAGLAFYALTEMMQKGTIYSKEFNRQLAQQVPGAASYLTEAINNMNAKNGKPSISIGEMYEMMKKGKIKSPEVLPEFADVLKKHFEPLLPLLQNRPDVQINNLKNSFFLFSQVVGTGFIGKLTEELKKMNGTLIVTDEQGFKHLNPSLEKFARNMGRDLGDTVRALGKAFEFLSTHAQLVKEVLKDFLIALAANAVLGFFNSIRSGIGTLQVMIDGVKKLTAAIFGLNAAEAAGAGVGVAKGSKFLKTGATAAALGAPGVANVANDVEGAAVASKGVPILGRLAGAWGALGGAMTLVGGTALGVGAIFLAVLGTMELFGGTITHVGGQTTTYHNIVMAVLDDLGNALDNFTKKLSGAFSGNNPALTSFGDAMGKIFLGVLVTVETLIHQILSLPRILFDVGAAAGAAAKANFPLAQKFITDAKQAIADPNNSYDANYQRLSAAAAARTAASNKPIGPDAHDAQTAEMEKVQNNLQALAAMDAAKKAESDIADLNRAIDSGNMGALTEKDLIASFDEQKKVTSDATKTNSDAAKVSADAAKTAADAAKLAATVATGGNVVTGFQGGGSYNHTMPTDLANAIKTAGGAQGVSPDLMAQIAWAEGGHAFKNISAKGSSAKGYFQETDGVSKGIDAMDPYQAAAAAAKKLRIDAQIIEEFKHEKATWAEIYSAWHDGVAITKQYINAQHVDPNRLAVDIVRNTLTANYGAAGAEKAIQANHNIYYEGNKPRTVSGVMKLYGSMMGSGGPALTGTPLQAESQGEEDTLESKFTKLQEMIANARGKDDPFTRANETYQKKLLDFRKIKELQDSLVESTGGRLKPLYNKDMLVKDIAEAKRIRDEALNPFTKEVHSMEDANAVLALRNQGLNDEADFQERLNKLREQGADVTMIDNKANRDAIQVAKDKQDVLKEQAETIKAMNDITFSRMDRNMSPFEAAVAHAIPNEHNAPFAVARKEAQDSGVEAEIRTRTAAQFQSYQQNATQDIAESIVELAASTHLNATARQWRDDYKSFLKDLTHSTSDSLATIESFANQGQKSLAESFANWKKEVENPPGFQKWANALEPVQKRLEDIKAGFMDTLSSSLADAFTGGKVDWGSITKNLTKQVFKVYIDEALKGIVTKFGKNGTPDMPPDVKAAYDAGMLGQQAAEKTLESAANLDQTAIKWDTVGDKWSTVADHMMQVGAGGGAGGAASGAGSIPNITSLLDAATGSGTSIPNITSQLDAMNATTPLEALTNVITKAPLSAGFSALGDTSVMGTPEGTTFQGNPIGNSGNLLDEVVATGKRSSGTMIPTTDLISPTTNVPGLQTMSQMLGDMSGFQSAGAKAAGKGGFWSSFGQSLIPLVLGGLTALFNQKKNTKNPKYPQQYVHGIIGEMRDISTTGREIPGHSNPIGDILSAVASMAMSSFSSAGGFSGGGMSSIGSGFSKFASMFSHFPGFAEGGYSTSPVSFSRMPSWRSIPHYADGTTNTSGFMAVLHPNEAVVPLSRGRSIPVDLGGSGGGGGVYVHAPMTIITPNADSFRASQNSIERKQSSGLRRAAARNLTA